MNVTPDENLSKEENDNNADGEEALSNASRQSSRYDDEEDENADGNQTKHEEGGGDIVVDDERHDTTANRHEEEARSVEVTRTRGAESAVDNNRDDADNVEASDEERDIIILHSARQEVAKESARGAIESASTTAALTTTMRTEEEEEEEEKKKGEKEATLAHHTPPHSEGGRGEEVAAGDDAAGVMDIDDVSPVRAERRDVKEGERKRTEAPQRQDKKNTAATGRPTALSEEQLASQRTGADPLRSTSTSPKKQRRHKRILMKSPPKTAADSEPPLMAQFLAQLTASHSLSPTASNAEGGGGRIPTTAANKKRNGDNSGGLFVASHITAVVPVLLDPLVSMIQSKMSPQQKEEKGGRGGGGRDGEGTDASSLYTSRATTATANNKTKRNQSSGATSVALATLSRVNAKTNASRMHTTANTGLNTPTAHQQSSQGDQPPSSPPRPQTAPTPRGISGAVGGPPFVNAAAGGAAVAGGTSRSVLSSSAIVEDYLVLRREGTDPRAATQITPNGVVLRRRHPRGRCLGAGRVVSVDGRSGGGRGAEGGEEETSLYSQKDGHGGSSSSKANGTAAMLNGSTIPFLQRKAVIPIVRADSPKNRRELRETAASFSGTPSPTRAKRSGVNTHSSKHSSSKVMSAAKNRKDREAAMWMRRESGWVGNRRTSEDGNGTAATNSGGDKAGTAATTTMTSPPFSPLLLPAPSAKVNALRRMTQDARGELHDGQHNATTTAGNGNAVSFTLRNTSPPPPLPASDRRVLYSVPR